MTVFHAQLLKVPLGDVTVRADIVVPAEARGLVMFAYGSGASRHGPRDQFVARVLQQSDFGTLLLPLLNDREEALDHKSRELRFDIDLLARRLTAAVEWVGAHPTYAALPLGLLCGSTGAAAALVVAAEHPARIRSVVSRGGRPDLAGDALPRVTAPTLLIVGGYDDAVLVLNEQAKARMTGEVSLQVVPRATHLFEEPGALAQVAEFAASWFWTTLKP